MSIRNFVRATACVLAIACAAGCRNDAPDVAPAAIAVDPANGITVPSGTTISLHASVTNAAGESLLNQPIVWTSSDENVATVSANGVVTGVHAGQTDIMADIGDVRSTAVTATVTPGAPAQLVIREQPAGAASGAALTTQPAIEIHDAAGNLIQSSTAPVTATIATGGGTITGSVVAAADGVATFTSLTITGTIGDRTLTFSSPGVPSITSIGVALDAGAPARIMIRTQPAGSTSGAAFTTQPVVELRDSAGNLSTASSATVTAGIGNGGGSLSNATAVASKGVATFSGLTLIGDAGDHTITFSAIGVATVSSASFSVASP